MSDDLDSETKNGGDTSLEPAKLIWDEYKYRHEHIWKLIIQITVAVVIISVIPYSQPHISERLREAVVLLPIVGFALTSLGLVRLDSELQILEKVRARHRELQSALHGIEHRTEAGRFNRHVKVYLGVIMFLEVANIVVLLWLWV